MKNKTLILACLLLFPILAYTQNNLRVNDVFEKYGKQEGSVLVQLSSDVLSQGNSRIVFYKSMITDTNSIKEQDVQRALKEDIKGNLIISEIKKGGRIESGTYHLGKNNNIHKYILYKNKSNKITLVYLEGKFPPEKLDYELKKLKDLFIYVNNKRIKLQ
ncbi:MAG: hypothetical protein E6767_08210 [Dysgonomonas sp.]|nr:hypothetical protein [Dysgonomonas sp.]